MSDNEEEPVSDGEATNSPDKSTDSETTPESGTSTENESDEGASAENESDDRDLVENDADDAPNNEQDAVVGMYEQDTEAPAETDTATDTEVNSNDASPPAGFDAPLMDAPDEPETSAGTFYVKFAEESAVTLHEVNTGQIFTLVENPGFERHEIIEAVLVAQPPMQVSYLIEELQSHRSIPVETSSEPPTRNVVETGREMDVGQAVAIDREGDGEIHILRVDPSDTERTVDEIHDDEMTYKNAARYDIGRVEIRMDDTDGIVSIRYLP